MKYINKLDKEKKNEKIFKTEWPTFVKDKSVYITNNVDLQKVITSKRNFGDGKMCS